MNQIKLNNSDVLINIISNRSFRTKLASQSHQWFFSIYLSHYINHLVSPFHKDFFALTEDETIRNLVIVAFRGSSKSTIFSTSYPIWAILGKQQKKFVVILGQTQRQAKQNLVNIKQELESNELLRKDLGPFKEETDEWGSYSLVIPKFNARIVAASMEQSIRGIRHLQYRPDLIIADDVENLASVKTQEGRDKVYDWITGEVIPAGDHNTKCVFIGNLLHNDSLLMRLKTNIDQGFLDGKFKAMPIMDDADTPTWPGKFPDPVSMQKNIGNQISWQREMMLRIVPDEGQIVYPEWIQTYDQIDESKKRYRYTLTGVDPAISTKNHADYTAAVSAKVYGYEKDLNVYILPNPINKRMNFPDSVETFKHLSKTLKTRLLIESNAYQKSLPEKLAHEGIPTEEVNSMTDKRARLNMVSHYIKDGRIIFPEKGAEQLLQQIIGFGVEKHDDLVDAFTSLVLKVIEEDVRPIIPEIFFI